MKVKLVNSFWRGAVAFPGGEKTQMSPVLSSFFHHRKIQFKLAIIFFLKHKHKMPLEVGSELCIYTQIVTYIDTKGLNQQLL